MRCAKVTPPTRGVSVCYSFQHVSPDDIRRAVLEREDVAKYLRDAQPRRRPTRANASKASSTNYARRSATASIARCSTRSIPFCEKSGASPSTSSTRRGACRRGRVVYVSNHKSHLDYLVEPLVLDDNGIRPPLLAAGINLFGGALGLLHKHVTGAVPIRRNSKDPLYLVTLRAYIAELLKERDLLYYAEGGRSYSGDLKTPKTGLLQAALQADRDELSIVPMAVAYDLVLEDRILSREASRKRKRPFAQEVAEMVRHAVGYESRAFVTFGPPIPLGSFDPDSRRDLVTLAHRVHDAVGRRHKVLPTALVASVMRPHMARAELDRASTIASAARRGGRQPRGEHRDGRPRTKASRARRARRPRRRGPDAPRARSRRRSATTRARSSICSRRPKDDALMLDALAESHVFAPRRQQHS